MTVDRRTHTPTAATTAGKAGIAHGLDWCVDRLGDAIADASPLNTLAASIHDNAVAHGFWEGERNFGEQIALMHSELSEALEEHRANRPDAYYSHDHCPPHATERIFAVLPTCKPEGVAVELIDCLIRCLDSLAALDVDVDALTAEKMAYNASRPIRHGKAY